MKLNRRKKDQRIFSTRLNRINFIIIYSVIIFIFGMIFYQQGYVGKIKQSIRYLKSDYSFSAIRNKAESLTADIDKLVIDVNFKNYQKLAFQRELAMKIGNAYRTHELNEGYVPCKVKYKGEKLKAKIRLKGGQRDHFGHDFKWSFKIKMKGDGRILNMKRFAIQLPHTRGYLNDDVLHKFMNYNDLISINYHFINLIINGKDYGIYMIEENMDKYVLEHNQLREGFIFNINDDLLWNKDVTNTGDVFATGNIDIYNENVILQDSILFRQFEKAKDLFELFRKRKLSTSEVFDVKKIAMFFAITDLFGHHHASYLYNLKFYYNPITTLIEPIGFDNQKISRLSGIKKGIDRENRGKLLGEYKYLGSNPYSINKKGNELAVYDFQLINGKRTSSLVEISGNSWHTAVFRDSLFYKEYIKALDKITKLDYFKNFYNEISEEVENQTIILHRSFPNYSFDLQREIINENAIYIQNFLHPKKCMNVHYNGYDIQKESLQIIVNNTSSIPLQIEQLILSKEILINHKNIVKKIALLPIGNKLIQMGKNSSPEMFEFRLPDKLLWTENDKTNLVVNYTIFGKPERIITSKVLPFPLFESDFIKKDIMRKETNIDLFDFLIVDETKKIISFPPKQISIDQNMIIPADYDVLASGGLGIDLINNAKIISKSNFHFYGTAINPIVIFSSDSTGQGILIMKSSDKSVFENVIFTNLSNLEESNWGLSGAVNTFESEVTFHQCIFQNNLRGDDFLNVISSKIMIDDCEFRNILADAFDGDFVQGDIINTSYYNIGNDAIDVSGSTVFISDVKISNSNDKGISVGENSRVSFQNIVIDNTKIAIASKDMSEVTGKGINISSVQIGFAAYQKKPSFGEAHISIYNLQSKLIETPFLIDEKSEIIIDGNKIKINRTENIRELLYEI